jgi:16S rRNA (uracil1498-N3)-methyltransferase
MSHRFYLAELRDSGPVRLDGLEAHHLMHVMRATPGDVVELFNGAGLVAQGEIVAVHRRDAELRVLDSRHEKRPSREVILATAVPKGDRFDWLVEKATELGVTRIVPLVTTRSVVDPRNSKLDKLRQTVITACKQCGRNHLLELSPVAAWNDFLSAELPNREGLIAHLGVGTVPLSTVNWGGQSSIVIAVGPEGGFTDAEVSMAVASGAKPVSLGPLTLRIETAALALAALAANAGH